MAILGLGDKQIVCPGFIRVTVNSPYIYVWTDKQTILKARGLALIGLVALLAIPYILIFP